MMMFDDLLVEEFNCCGLWCS